MEFQDITSIVSFITALGSLGGVFFLRSKVRKARAEAKQAELTVNDTVLQQKDSILEDYRRQKEDALALMKTYQEEARAERERASRERELNISLQEQMNEKTRENIELRDQIAKAQYYRCEVNNCSDRRPPPIPMGKKQKKQEEK